MIAIGQGVRFHHDPDDPGRLAVVVLVVTHDRVCLDRRGQSARKDDVAAIVVAVEDGTYQPMDAELLEVATYH